MYSRTSLFSLGMTITLPELALCIAHRIRMSAYKGLARVKVDSEEFHLEHTKVGYRKYIKDSPDKVSLLAFHLEP